MLKNHADICTFLADYLDTDCYSIRMHAMALMTCISASSAFCKYFFLTVS